MINLPGSIDNWNQMSSEEQKELGKVLAIEYQKYEKPLNELLWIVKEKNYNPERARLATLALDITHDWRRIKNNLLFYSRDDEANSLLIFQAVMKLYPIVALLEFIIPYLPKVEES